MIANLLRDVRYTLRQLRKTPGFTVTAVLTLALGIGANTAIFTLVHAILLKNLPVADPRSLVRLGDNETCCNLNLASFDSDYNLFSYDGYKHLRDHTAEFEELAAMQAGAADLSVRRSLGDAPPQFARGEFVSGNYFQMFGVKPFAGRATAPSDDADGAPPVAVMSYQTWQRDYAGDPSVVGTSFFINTHPVTVIGVAPEAFYGDRLTESPPDYYLPIAQEPALGVYAVRNVPQLGWLFLIGRVHPGTALGPLQAKVSGLLRQSLAQLAPYQTEHGKEQLAKARVVLTPGGVGIANMQHSAANSLHLLSGLSFLVLLIACANIASLMLVRGVSRRTQISIRMALGAARARVVWQMITESMVLSCFGGLAGLVLAYGGTQLLLGWMFPNSPNLPIHAGPSLPVVAFTFGVSLLTGLVFGIAPAWISSKEQPANAMRGVNRSTSDHSSLMQRSLVILQAALSLVLLVGAGLLGKSLSNLEHQQLGLETDNRVMVSLNPLKAGYKPQQLQALYQQIEDKFHTMPGVGNGVEHVGLSLYTPLGFDYWTFYAYVQGQRPPAPGEDVTAMFNRASPEYFKAIGQRVVRGRVFTAADTATSQGVAVVNEAFVKKFFKPGEDPIGQHLGGNDIKNAGDFEIVGVVEDTRYHSAREPAIPMYFTPMLQQSHTSPPKDPDVSLYAGSIVLQMRSINPNLEPLVRKTLASIDPNLTVDYYQTFAQQIHGNFNEQRMVTRLTLVFGLLALVLASIGLYGVTAYMVVRRTPEIGIRMALGADRSGVIRMVLSSAMLQAGLGLALGVPAALLSVRFVKSQLYQVSGQDVWVMAGAACALAGSAFIAGLIPARRAASTDPMRALRSE